MKRLFIGIPIKSETVVSQTGIWQSNRLLNQNQFVWTKPENWHVTFYFLGDTPDNRVQQLNRLVDESFSGIVGFTTEIFGAGVFPNNRNPKVFWLGIKMLVPVMKAYVKLGELLRINAFEFDEKPLSPHLTLARIKKLEYSAVFNALLDQFGQVNFGQVIIDQVVIFESILTSSGPVYKPVHITKLSK